MHHHGAAHMSVAHRNSTLTYDTPSTPTSQQNAWPKRSHQEPSNSSHVQTHKTTTCAMLLSRAR
ncbi:hypothetical protein GQ44DRAFT_718243 [Phaeosphaeriaceae sp. PMI808]|nr:hypothetical protein GQ44DRAFT_718243 [Phaeosphaeriaceae sp. PMI808]